tara:strand:- start:3239 stop:4036 length:798 start_codon:yes stop_codon:yes gene_type:complete
MDIIKPIFKWAGGKRQLLPYLKELFPTKFNKYIEPFVGGGAVFFYLKPEISIISDSNDELINAYKTLSSNSEDVIKELKNYENTKEFFYKIRSEELCDTVTKAARTIYLNKTCFNGLYRVNKKGKFNVPFGYYKNPKYLDKDNLVLAVELLKKATILSMDYKKVLESFSEKDDFIFLDPPYLPVSKYSDFKRYTKEQFYLEDHKELADYFHLLNKKKCKVILTNSNNQEILKLYKDFNIKILDTKRSINSHGRGRVGKDIIVSNF